MQYRFVGILLAILSLLGVSIVTAGPAHASAPVLLPGSSWLGGNGANVCTNNNGGGGDPYCGNEYQTSNVAGAYWQCVELAQRLYQKRGWHGGIFAGVAGAKDIYNQAGNLGMSRQANGSVNSIVPGDMIVHDGDAPYTGGAGHVSIVDRVEGSTVHVVEQNTYNDQPRATYSLMGGMLTRPGTGTIRGVVHDPANQSQSSGGSSGGSFSDDAKADVLWYESSNNGTAKLIKTNAAGTGGEAPNVWFSGYAKPTWAGHGDFNGDGKTDLAWYESWNNGTMKVLLSNGTGFGSTHTWFSGYAAPTKAFVGDFTGDGKDDIGWYESWNNGGTLKVIKTASNGTSNGGSYTWLSGFASPDWSDAGDLNGDGKDDLAWFESWNNGSLKVIYSSGSGTSSIATWFSGYAKPTWAAIGNFTGGPDKKEDLAWYESWNNGTLKVIPSNGNSSGTPITWFSGYATPTLAFAADVDGDGRSDLGWYEVSNNGTMKVILTNSAGTGGASSHTWFSGFAKPDWAAIG